MTENSKGREVRRTKAVAAMSSCSGDTGCAVCMGGGYGAVDVDGITHDADCRWLLARKLCREGA